MQRSSSSNCSRFVSQRVTLREHSYFSGGRRRPRLFLARREKCRAAPGRLVPGMSHTSLLATKQGIAKQRGAGDTGENCGRMRMRGLRGAMERKLVGMLCAAVIVLLLPGHWLCAQEGKPGTRAELEKAANESTVEITTIGRKSGKPHTKPVWFVYDQGHFYLQSGKEGKSDWYQNLQKNPQITLKIGALTFAGKARFIDDPQES